jgi:hypothetical protein
LRLNLFLTTDPKPANSRTELFGAFKGRARVRDGYAALLRLLWASHGKFPERFEYPAPLVRRVPPARFEIRFRDDFPRADSSRWLRLIRQLLNGTSRSLIPLLIEKLLERDGIPAFYRHLIQQDVEALEDFFQGSARRNRQLRKAHGLKNSFIPQDEIDDLLVLSATE